MRLAVGAARLTLFNLNVIHCGGGRGGGKWHSFGAWLNLKQTLSYCRAPTEGPLENAAEFGRSVTQSQKFTGECDNFSVTNE